MSFIAEAADYFVKPVEGHDDLFAFKYDFTLGEKALAEQVVEETDDGDLIIEGYAAVFEGIDREGENFAPGAFQEGIKSFLQKQSPLCFHHDHKLVLGKVLDMQEDQKGLKIRARVDGATQKHPVLGTVYEQVKRGTLNGLSVAGFFKRALTEAGRRIVGVDFTETSVTGVPVHPGTNFAVVAGKALASDLSSEHVQIPDFPEDEIREEDFFMAQEALGLLDRVFSKLEKRGDGGSNPSQTATPIL